MKSKLVKINDLKAITKKLKDSGKKIVFTYGTFDLIHSGHAAYLLKAKSLGDVLIVGVASNTSQRKIRGKGFPLIDQKNRAELIGYFDFVDQTVIVNNQDLTSFLKTIKPDIFYSHSLDWKSHLRKPSEEKIAKKFGMKIVKVTTNEPVISASLIVEHVADLKIKEIMEYFFGKINIDLTKGDWRQKKFSGMKTKVRTPSLYFGDHTKYMDLFMHKEYLAEIVDRKKLKQLGEKLRKDNKKIVISAGSCDLLHSGHARFFWKARQEGDVLVLALPSDKIIQKQKGRGRPVVNEKSRAELMQFFDFVDYIVIFDDESVLPLVKELRPDVFFTVKEDWNELSQSRELDFMKEWNGKIISSPPQATGLSSSKLIRKAAGIRVKEVFKEILDEAKKSSVLKD